MEGMEHEIWGKGKKQILITKNGRGIYIMNRKKEKTLTFLVEEEIFTDDKVLLTDIACTQDTQMLHINDQKIYSGNHRTEINPSKVGSFSRTPQIGAFAIMV